MKTAREVAHDATACSGNEPDGKGGERFHSLNCDAVTRAIQCRDLEVNALLQEEGLLDDTMLKQALWALCQEWGLCCRNGAKARLLSKTQSWECPLHGVAT